MHSQLQAQLHELYAHHCCHPERLAKELPNLATEDDFAKMLTNMVQQIWADKGLPNGTINKAVTNEFAKRLWGGVTNGYGDKAKAFAAGKLDWETPDYNMLAALQKNVWHFAAAKNYQQLRALSNALIGEDGKLRTYRQFKAEALKINDQHVNQWLQAEYNLAVAGGQMAGKWVSIEANANALPYLEFDATVDKQTSDLCRSLNGTVLPINHPFWNTYYPPNHFNCRSTVRQRSSSATITKEADIPSSDIPPMFRTNLAKQWLAFPDGHAYYNGLPLLAKKQAEAMVIDPNFSTRLQGKKGGYVDIHAKADANKKQQHIEAAQVLADKGNQLKLMPEIHIKDVANRKLFFPELIGNSNPDARFNGILGDFKIPDSKTITYDIATRCITETAKKNVSICAISLLEKEYKLNDVLNGIKGALKNENYNKSIKEVWIILKDKSVLKIPRGVINNNKFYDIAQAL